MQSKVGRITDAQICIGGRYDSELGLRVDFAAERHNGQEDSAWQASSFESIPYAFNPQGQATVLVSYLGDLLTSANIKSVRDLTGKPVICTFESSGRLYSWCLLKTMDG